MNCEQVFNVLTRGPFPTGDPIDGDVEDHLAECADCWRLALALRPALDVFQEAVPAAEGRELPGYWGDARPESLLMPQLTDDEWQSGQSTRTLLAAAQIRASQPLAISRGWRQPNRSRLSVRAIGLGIVASSLVATGLWYLLG